MKGKTFNLLLCFFTCHVLSLILMCDLFPYMALRFYNQGQIQHLCHGKAGRYVEHLGPSCFTSLVSSYWLLNGSISKIFASLIILNSCHLNVADMSLQILAVLDLGRDAWISREDWIHNGIHIGSNRKYKDSYYLQAQAMCYMNSWRPVTQNIQWK